MHSDLAWDDVRLFLVLCRCRTMGEAAKVLDVDPSTVSRRLVQLESTLETVLFDRGRDGLRATEAAEQLLPKAERVELGVAQFANATERLERDVTGEVRIACPPDVADVIILPAIRPLLSRYPGLRHVLQPGEAVVDLTRREADIALRIVRPQQGDLVMKRLVTVAWRPASTKRLAARYAPIRDPSAMPWIGWTDRYRDLPPNRWLATHVAREPILRTDSQATSIAAAKAGMGVVLLPEPTIHHYRLVPLDFAPELAVADAARPADALFLVTHRSLKDVPRVRAVWDAIVGYIDTVEWASPSM